MELSIVLPTYNEGRNLEVLIPKIINLIEDKVDKLEIIVVDDNSTDETNKICEKLNNIYQNINLISRKEKPSLPLSIYQGIISAKYEYVMWLDADGSMTPIAIAELLEQQKINPNNVIIGSRFVEGGGYKGIEKDSEKNLLKTLRNIYNSEDSILAVILSKLFNNLLYVLMNIGIRDMTSGFIIGKKEYFLSEKIYQCFNNSDYGEYFAFLVNELDNNDIKMKEVGYICATRIYGSSKTGTNYLQLIKRGIPYLTTAYKIRYNNERNKR